MLLVSKGVQGNAVVSSVSELPLPLWEANSNQVLSWWDMEQFAANMFYWAGCALEAIKTDCLMNPAGTGGDEPIPLSFFHQQLDDRTKIKATDSLKRVESECRKVGLGITADTIQDLIQKVEKESRLTFNILWQDVSNIQRLIQREMRTRVFLYLPPERVKFWPLITQPHGFGAAVAKALPSTNYDTFQAGVALATGLSTACVFHLMRILEIGLGALGAKFGVSLAHTNWGPAIEEIESKIRNMHKDPAWKALLDCKEQQEFYAQAASHFAVLKDAWRNYTMHSRGKYTEDEAEIIFISIKGFMQKLAERLSE